jgi:N-acyl homoserine lactone hydrolase
LFVNCDKLGRLQVKERAVPSVGSKLDHSIWSFCYAKGQLPRDFIEGSPVGSNQGMLPIPMVYTVIVTPPSAPQRSVFLVDAGFAAARSMTGRAFADFESPAAILGKVELEAREVKTLLLTHMHFDHMGNIEAFPEANILLQRSEYDWWKWALGALPEQSHDKQNWVLSSMNPGDIHRLDRAISDGRVTFIDGTHEVSPGITLQLVADTHTPGSQWIEVSTPVGPYIVAGDAIVSFANLERMWPPGYHQGNTWNLLAAYQRAKDVAGERWPERILPGHDMELFSRFPNWTAGSNPVAEVHIAFGQRSFAART